MVKVLVRFKGHDRNLQLYYVDPGTGREISKSSRTKNMRDAERAALTWESELEQWRGKDDSGWAYFRERFDDEHLASLSKHTRKSYRTALNHFERLITVSEVSKISSSTLSIFKKLLLKEKKPATTVSSYLNCVRAAFKWAEEVGIIRHAPKIKNPPTVKRRMARCRPITYDEYQLMLANCCRVVKVNPFPLRRFLELLWLSGLRLSEALALSWDSPPIRVDMEAKPFPVMLIYGEAQKSRQDEAMPIGRDFIEWLQATPERERRGLVAPLRRPNGNVYDSDKASRLIGDLGYLCGIRMDDKGKFASAHDYRRAYGSRWAKVVPPVTLQRMMCHADLKTTMNFYVELSVVDISEQIWQTVPATVPKNETKTA